MLQEQHYEQDAAERKTQSDYLDEIKKRSLLNISVNIF
jgi:hypothetical protein